MGTYLQQKNLELLQLCDNKVRILLQASYPCKNEINNK